MSRIEIRPYDGNLEALRKLAYRSWPAEYKDALWPDLYTRTISRYYIESASDPRLMVGAYLEDELVGFMANLPRKYRFRGQVFKGMLSSLLAISPDCPGALAVMLSACLKGNQDFDADFTVFTLDKGHKLLRHAGAMQIGRLQETSITECLTVERTLVHAIDFPTIQQHEGLGRLATLGIKTWGAHRPLQPVQTQGEVRPCQAGDLPEVLALTEQIPDQDQLVRIFDLPALERRFSPGDLSAHLGGMVVYEHRQKIKGFISYSFYDMVNPRGTHPWAWIDLVCWENCLPRERQALLAGAWEQSKAHGCIGVLAWTRQKMSYLPFFRSRFLPYPEPMNVQVVYLRPGISLKGVSGVFEQVI
jgi:hypothetical protein